MSKTYVIVTDDGPGCKDVFLTWTTASGGYYTTVDELEDICFADIYHTVKRAEERAREANSGTLFGWQAPMTICEVLNYDAAVNGHEEPDLLPIETITFHH